MDVALAKRLLKDVISKATARHLIEFYNYRMPDWILSCRPYTCQTTRVELTACGERLIFPASPYDEVSITTTIDDFHKHFAEWGKVSNLERLGVSGDWITCDWKTSSVQYHQVMIVDITLRKVH